MTSATISADHATCESVGLLVDAKDIGDAESVALAYATEACVNDYLSAFAAPTGKCLKCDVPVTGLITAVTGGGMQWDLAWGEMRCRQCGWPGRGYHDPKDENGESIYGRHLPLVLQYHPDYVTVAKAESR